MLKIENHCCGCAVPGYPCRGNACELRHVEVFYCDKCNDEIYGDVYYDEEQDLCEACLLKKYRKED